MKVVRELGSWKPGSATPKRFKVEAGINGLRPAARVPSIYSVSPLRVLECRLPTQREVTVICVGKILRIFAAQIAEFVPDGDSGVFVRWQPSDIDLANTLPTKEDLKEILLLARAKGDGQPGKSLPGVKPMALEAHFAFGPHPPYQIALQILDFW